MKYFSCITAMLCVALAAASAQVASHAPTAMNGIVNTTVSTPPPAPTGSSMQVTGRPVARVNGAILTDRDLLREMLQLFPYARVHNGFPKAQEAQIRRGALSMIEFEELVYQEAERRKMTVPAARIDRAVAEYRSNLGGNEEFKQYLNTEMGGSLQQFRKQIRRSLLIEALLHLEVDRKSGVSLAEARAYYDKNAQMFNRDEAFAFQTISIMPAPTASPELKQKARKDAEEMLKKAKATGSYEEFGLLAEKISQDDYRVNMGDHKLVPRDKLPNELVQRALKMRPGEVSDLIQVESFYFCFRLNAHVPAGKVRFEEVKDQLMKDLARARKEDLRKKLDARLRVDAKVEEL